MPLKKGPMLRARFDGILKALLEEVTRDNLPRRIFRCVLATTICVIIILIPGISHVYGKAGYLACLTTVFVMGHPGRRLGGMVEGLSMAAVGASIGIGWAALGSYLSSLAFNSGHRPAAMAIKAMFLLTAALIHGYVRLKAPRLYLLVLMMLIPALMGLTLTTVGLTTMFPVQYFYPILTAIVVLLLVNIFVFPEFGGTQLCTTTIETLHETKKVQRDAAELFIAFSVGDDPVECVAKLGELSKSKADLRAKVVACSAIFTECSFELSYSVLAPQDLKPISRSGMKHLVSKTLSLVGTCESAYALLEIATEMPAEINKVDAKRFKTRRESMAGHGDKELLKFLLKRVETPLRQLQSATSRALDIVSACVAHAYDTPVVSISGKAEGRARQPDGILLQEIDIHINWLETAIIEFGNTSTAALEKASVLHPPQHRDEDVDFMPREEVFLISSFVMNFRHGATHTLGMLKHSRGLVEERIARKGRKSLHFPKIKLNKWLFASTEERDAIIVPDRETFEREPDNKSNEEFINGKSTKRRKHRRSNFTGSTFSHKWRKFRRGLGRLLDWMANSNPFLYAIKFSIGVMLLSFPAFVTSWSGWYSENRGVWAPLILVLVFENAVGSTIWIFILRTVGTIIGSTWGYAAFQSRNGNVYTITVMLMLACFPNYYVQLGTKYQKAGMVCTISMCVVALSTHLQTVPGTSFQIFYKRVITMLIGGFVATLIQVILFPVKARVHLKEHIASAIVQINRMESCLASGVDAERNIITSHTLFSRFETAHKKASASLNTAEAFLGFTRQEPRIKGSFETQAIVYKEIIFVLRQIADRMENMVQLRQTYGSAVLESYNSRVFNYRRNVAAAMTLTLCIVHEALITKLPLPQFMPSVRLAHMRMVLKVRQILLEESTDSVGIDSRTDSAALEEKRSMRLKFLSWNASSAALEECIEYLEELINLMKTLVGANEFRSGILNRPAYREYVDNIRVRDLTAKAPIDPDAPLQDDHGDTHTVSGLSLGKTSTLVLEGMPDSLTRIQSRRMEAKLAKRTNALQRLTVE